MMLAYLFVILAIAVRFIPHPFAFTPVGASLLFFGAYASRRRLWIPVVLLALSDIILTTAIYRYSFGWDHIVTWVWYAGMLWLGSNLRNNAKILRVLGAALSGSISFYVISNFAVWAEWHMYPKNIAGLIACYEAGIPFFRKAVASDLIFAAAMFAVPVVIEALTEIAHRSADSTSTV